MKGYRNLKRIFLTGLCIILCCFTGNPFTCKADAVQAKNQRSGYQQKQQVVKVAYFNMGDYYTKGAGESVISYDTEALKKISDASGLTFEYIDCGTWANALSMLEKHQIDLVGTAQWTSEREEQYEYCLESYGYTVGELAALPESGLVYEDYEAIGNSTIGYVSNYVRYDEMQEVFEEHQIAPTMKSYDSQKALENALASGEVDIIAANSHTLKDNLTVLEKFSYSPYYLISWKGNQELTDILDSAIIKLNLEQPLADDELIQKYFPNLLGEPLTKEELDLIHEGKTYTIYYSGDVKPLAWYDQETDTMKGALVDACRQISQNTGLKISIRPLWEKPEISQDTQIRYTTLFYNSSSDISNNAGVTDALIDEPFNLFRKSGENFDMNSSDYTIAIVKNRNKLEDYIRETYPGCKVVIYDSPSECIQKLEAGKVDMAYLNVHVADNVLTELSIDDIRELAASETTHGIGLIFEGEDKELLESIVNKGIQKMDYTAISDAMVQYALTTRETVTLRTIMRDYTGWVIVVAVILIAGLMTIIYLRSYATAMRKQRDQVEKANADRSEFFARMSHDMRTPMNGILGMLDLSKRSNDVNEIHDNIEKALASGEYMLSLINDTLDLQKLETKKLQLNKQTVYAKDYLDSIFAMLNENAVQKGIIFRLNNINVDLNRYVEMDPIRVKQIFTNLLSNAIKFTAPGGTVEVTMECLNQEEDTLHHRYIIRDTGVGMTKDFIENQLYQPYAQENNNLTKELTGTGLGLAITKNLIDIMGGQISVESEPGVGTTFTIYLDFRYVPENEAELERKKKEEKATDVRANLNGKRILVCEDHPLNAEITSKLLQTAGCVVTVAENGKIGLDTFSESELHYFDAVLMDIRMPVMNGLEAAKAIRALEREDAKTIPIIAMTANAYDADIQKSLDAGMNAHLAKPINPMIVFETLGKFCS